MFDIGYSELLLIAVVALIVIGPKDLPRVMRTVGHWVGRARGSSLGPITISATTAISSSSE